MQRRNTFLGILVALLALVAAACGGGGGDEASVESGDPVDLGAAFSELASASGHRMTQWTAQTIDVQALGMQQSSSIDPDRPTAVGEFAEGRSHVTMDLAALLGPMADDLGSITMEVWTDPERIVMDTTSFAAVVERAPPGTDFGPLAPGLAYVDLARVGVDAPEFVAVLIGSGLPDLAELATSLPTVLDDLEQPDDDTVTGTAAYTDVLEVFGGDAEQQVRSIAAGAALTMGADVDQLTEFYLDFFSETDSEVTVRLAEGAVRRLELRTDISDVFASAAEEFGGPAPSLEDAEFVVDVVLEFEAVDDLVIEAAPETTDDRTDAWLAFLAASGF